MAGHIHLTYVFHMVANLFYFVFTPSTTGRKLTEVGFTRSVYTQCRFV